MTLEASLERCALVVIDVQRGFDEPVWGRRNNPSCEQNVGKLIASWRRHRRPTVYVRHDSLSANSPLRAGTAGNAFKEVIKGEPDLLVVKHVNSAFYGRPDLDAWLRRQRIKALAICGITTNHCCETTARMAGNLGNSVWFVADATHTFDRPGRDGSVIPAEVIQAISEANLADEFATVVDTHELVT